MVSGFAMRQPLSHHRTSMISGLGGASPEHAASPMAERAISPTPAQSLNRTALFR